MSVTIVGEDFRGIPQVYLIGVGRDISCTGVNVTAESRINCSFYIADAEPGARNILVVNPDGTKDERSNAFTITAPPTPTSTPTTSPTPTSTTEAPAVTSIDMAAGAQSAPVGQSVTLYALVRDQFGSGMSAISVEFIVVDGQAELDPASDQTTDSGQAQTQLTSGVSGEVRVRAKVDAVSNYITVTFTE